MVGRVGHEEPLLFQRYLDIETGLAPHHAGDVAAASEIVCQHDISWPKAPLCSVPNLDLALAGKGDDVLAARCWMPVLNLAGRTYAELYSFSGLKLFDLNLYLVKMGFAVVSCVESSDLHNPALVEKLLEKSKLIFHRQHHLDQPVSERRPL